MRIVAGEARGRRIRCIDEPGLRPTPDRVREALFSVLGALAGCAVLDLFAGTGALAVEALSRGASRAVLIESNPKVVDLIRQNVAALDMTDRTDVVRGRLPACLERVDPSWGPFDVVLIDAPYDTELGHETLEDPALARLISPDAVIALEHEEGRDTPEATGGLVRTGVRTYGSTALSLYSASSAHPSSARTGR